MKSVLLIEDDLSLSSMLALLLAKKGLAVSKAATLKDAFELLEQKSFDVALVDRGLPDGDGLEFIEYVRDSYPTLPVVCLSKKHLLEDRVTTLREGADDYLPKPFATTELLLKLEKWLHVYKTADVAVLQAGQMCLYPETGCLAIADKQLFLRRRESQILGTLIKHYPSLVTREMLISHIWQGEAEVPTYATLDVYIRRLRIILGQYSSMLTTVRGFGYRLSV